MVVKPVCHDDDEDGEDDGDGDNGDVVYEITKIETTLNDYRRKFIHRSGISTILID